MTTTQKIQAVLATGKLALPPCVSIIKLDDGPLLTCRAVVVDNTEPWRLQEALDKIAMHWAREIWSEAKSECRQNMSGTALERFDDAMADGDSEAAIRAIHAALSAEESNDITR